MREYIYGAFGSKEVFWNRLKCHLLFRHDWKFLDAYGNNQQCNNCGLYRRRRGW